MSLSRYLIIVAALPRIVVATAAYQHKGILVLVCICRDGDLVLPISLVLLLLIGQW